jgi:TatD DNase family protein
MLQELPLESILTETDAPYLSPVKGQRNEPSNVVDTVKYFAELRQIPLDKAQDIIWQNYCRLLGVKASS